MDSSSLRRIKTQQLDWIRTWLAQTHGITACTLSALKACCAGNHEIEAQEDANNTIFASVQARWKVNVS